MGGIPALGAPARRRNRASVFKIANKWDGAIFGGNTFADLRRREASGDSPYVILNGTTWDSGRRFVFTNLPQSEFSYRFVERTREYVAASDLPREEIGLLDQRLRPEMDRFRPITAEEIGADLSSLKVAFAVATSASVPLLIGPVLYSVGEVNDKSPCLHVGDGGMFDNQGVESLAQVFFGKLMPPAPDAPAIPKARRGLMIVIDGSYPMHDLNFGEADWVYSYLKRSPSRVSDIMEERALSYQLLLWSILRAASSGPHPVIPGPNQLQLVYFRHIDAAKAIAEQPDGLCGWTTPQDVTVVANKLRDIPTRFKVDPKCDAPLLERAAKELVARTSSGCRPSSPRSREVLIRSLQRRFFAYGCRPRGAMRRRLRHDDHTPGQSSPCDRAQRTSPDTDFDRPRAGRATHRLLGGRYGFGTACEAA